MKVRARYTNWRGVEAERTFIPIRLYWGRTGYHPDEQWLLEAFDCDKGVPRTFAMKDFGPWEAIPSPAT